MKETFIEKLLRGGDSIVDKHVRICGWIHNLRDVGRIKFIVVRDRTGIIQAVFKKGCCEEKEFKRLGKLKLESVVCVEGTLIRGKAKQGYEITGYKLEIINEPIEPLPLEPDTSREAGLATRLNYRWLDTRNPKTSWIFQIESFVAKVFREYYRDNGFVEIFTPKIVAAGTESGAEVFPVIYFGREAYLAQSPQFYKQMAVIGGFERVFELGPVFRAEPHHTSRHLTEYHSMDIEIGFIDGPEDVIKYVEGFFKKLAYELKRDQHTKAILEAFNIEDIRVPSEIPRISIRDAYGILDREYGKKLGIGEDLDNEAEKLLGQYVSEKHDSDFVFITEYPWNARPFYTMRLEQSPEWTTGFDLLYRGLEVVTGSQREHRYQVLLENLTDKGLSRESFEFYLSFFKHGAPPHGGAGMGLERIVMQTLMLDNIREARLLPRDPERLLP